MGKSFFFFFLSVVSVTYYSGSFSILVQSQNKIQTNVLLLLIYVDWRFTATSAHLNENLY